MSGTFPESLDLLPHRQTAQVSAVAWDVLTASEARRLREFGLDDGIEVELLHEALGRGPLAVRLGRMTVALRRHVAAAIKVSPPVAAI